MATRAKYRLVNFWGCSSAGRAPRSQRGGRGFESHHLHQELSCRSRNRPAIFIFRCKGVRNDKVKFLKTIHWTVFRNFHRLHRSLSTSFFRTAFFRSRRHDAPNARASLFSRSILKNRLAFELALRDIFRWTAAPHVLEALRFEKVVSWKSDGRTRCAG